MRARFLVWAFFRDVAHCCLWGLLAAVASGFVRTAVLVAGSAEPTWPDVVSFAAGMGVAVAVGLLAVMRTEVL